MPRRRRGPIAIGAALIVAGCVQPPYPIKDGFDERIKAGCATGSECTAILADARERRARYCAIAEKWETSRTRCEQVTAEARAAEALRPTVTVSTSHVEGMGTPQPSAQAGIVEAAHPAEPRDDPAVDAATIDAARSEEDERRRQVQSEIVARVLADQRRATSPKPNTASSTDQKVAMIRAECRSGSCRAEKLGEIVSSAETATEKAVLIRAARAEEDAYCARVGCFRK